MNLGADSWRNHMTGRIADAIERYGVDAYFLDIVGGHVNSTTGDMHEGTRRLVDGSAREVSEGRRASARCRTTRCTGSSRCTTPAAAPRWQKYSRFFQHLSAPAPGRGQQRRARGGLRPVQPRDARPHRRTPSRRCRSSTTRSRSTATRWRRSSPRRSSARGSPKLFISAPTSTAGSVAQLLIHMPAESASRLLTLSLLDQLSANGAHHAGPATLLGANRQHRRDRRPRRRLSRRAESPACVYRAVR